MRGSIVTRLFAIAFIIVIGGQIVAQLAPPLTKNDMAVMAGLAVGLSILYAKMWRRHYAVQPVRVRD